MTGIIFDIKEFAINDGPGIRLTVFLKGCPLRCLWCHNPEGMSFEPQFNSKTGKLTGKIWSADKLAAHIASFADLFKSAGGGVTFSGGEPAAQADFLLETIGKLPDIHINLDTSGFCDAGVFKSIAAKCNLIFFDLKLGDNEAHKKHTGQGNAVILENLRFLSGSGVPFHIRIPLIPEITDTAENLESIRQIVLSLPHPPDQMDLLPYNRLAGGKYETYGMKYPLAGKKETNNSSVIEGFIKTMRSRCCKVEMAL